MVIGRKQPRAACIPFASYNKKPSAKIVLLNQSSVCPIARGKTTGVEPSIEPKNSNASTFLRSKLFAFDRGTRAKSCDLVSEAVAVSDFNRIVCGYKSGFVSLTGDHPDVDTTGRSGPRSPRRDSSGASEIPKRKLNAAPPILPISNSKAVTNATS